MPFFNPINGISQCEQYNCCSSVDAAVECLWFIPEPIGAQSAAGVALEKSKKSISQSTASTYMVDGPARR